MNGTNSIQNGCNHFKTISQSNNDLPYSLRQNSNVLPSIANLSNVSPNGSFNSYVNSEIIGTTDYSIGNDGLYHFPLPAIRGFSQTSNQQYFNQNNINNFTQSACNPTNSRYQYQEFNYHPIIPDQSWIDSYSNDCLKQSVAPSFQNCCLSNRSTILNSSSKSASTKSATHIKDEKYSLRRQKNNLAAKKCRDNKKLKNQEVSNLIKQYESDNENLKHQISLVKSAIEDLMKQLR